MKKTFVAVVLCMALLSSFTVSASAEFTSSDSSNLTEIKKQVQAIRDQLGYPPGGFSSLRDAVNHIANNLPSSPKDYSTALANINSNLVSLVSYIKLIEGDTNNISARATDLLNKLNDVYLRQGQMQIAITNHIDSASALNHADLSRFFDVNYRYEFDEDTPFILAYSSLLEGPLYGSFGAVLSNLSSQLSSEESLYLSSYCDSPTLYSLVHLLQQVLATEDDLQLKKDNKANEDAATDAFVNGNSSKTSLGAGDIGNLKDVGGSFNDLTSLNGQSSVTSFLNGLTSADGTGQGWFSEATRASLDAVSTPLTTTRLVQKTWRGEKSLIATVSDDSSVNLVDSSAPASDPDPYNMSGFEDNYNWLWGDAS